MLVVKRIRVGVMGAGTIVSQRHLPELSSHPEVEVVGVADLDSARARLMCDTYGIAEAFGGPSGWSTMLEKTCPEAVYVATPNAWHCRMTLAALERGAHVLVEKPIAPNTEDGRAMVLAAEERQLVLAVGHHRRGMDLYQMCRRKLEDGIIGDVIGARMLLGHNLARVWASASWLTASPDQGGVLLDLGTHAIDTILWLLGRDVLAVGGRAMQSRQGRSPDAGLIWMQLAGDVYATVEVSWRLDPTTKNLYIFGEKGTIVADETDGQGGTLRVMSAESAGTALPARTVLNSAGLPDYGVTTGFVDAICGRDAPWLCLGRDGLQAVDVVERALRSSKSQEEPIP